MQGLVEQPEVGVEELRLGQEPAPRLAAGEAAERCAPTRLQPPVGQEAGDGAAAVAQPAHAGQVAQGALGREGLRQAVLLRQVAGAAGRVGGGQG